MNNTQFSAMYDLNRWCFRFLIAGGLLCSAAFFASLYFGMSPDSTYEMLYLPFVVQGTGMLLVIGIAVYNNVLYHPHLVWLLYG